MNKDNLNSNLNEVRILKMLSHTNIIQIKEKLNKKSLANIDIVMEFCECIELIEDSLVKIEDNLKKIGDSLDLLDFICIAKQILEGVQYLHSCNIIHFDLKLANILMNKNFTIKIIDFGSAINLNNKNQQYQLNPTPENEPPEMVLAEATYIPSYHYDIWCVGLLLYRLLFLEVKSFSLHLSSAPIIKIFLLIITKKGLRILI